MHIKEKHASVSAVKIRILDKSSKDSKKHLYTFFFYVFSVSLQKAIYLLKSTWQYSEEETGWGWEKAASFYKTGIMQAQPRIPPFHQQEPGASSEPVLLPVLSWFDSRAL